MKWVVPTEYGELDITVNLSKPEKDPKAIAAARDLPAGGYPMCQLCAENEGYAGRLDHPARSSHRIIPITIHGAPWFLQYSPYVYYNEHCIVPQRPAHPHEDRPGLPLRKLLDFVRQFPHYFVGSNADLPIVGGSILSPRPLPGRALHLRHGEGPGGDPCLLPGLPRHPGGDRPLAHVGAAAHRA